MSNRLRAAARTAAVGLLLVLGAPPLAVALEISPVRLDFTGASTAVVTLRNNDATEISVQAEAFDWSQDERGEDRLVSTRELLVVPPVFTLPPGESQLVRVAYTGDSQAVERSFRLVFAQLPPARPPQLSKALSVRLRLSIPAFVAASGPLGPRLRVADFVQDGPDAGLVLANDGDRHLRIRRLEFVPAAGPTHSVQRADYLLAGSQRPLSAALPDDRRVSRIVIDMGDGAELEHVVP
jgi:fimbrial chaperone protein